MNIKATRLQAWAPARVGRRPPLPPSKTKKKFWGSIGGLFATFLHMGAYLLRFSHFWGPFYYFLISWWGLLFGLAPPPLQKFLLAPMVARRVREHAPRKYFCVTAI